MEKDQEGTQTDITPIARYFAHLIFFGWACGNERYESRVAKEMDEKNDIIPIKEQNTEMNVFFVCCCKETITNSI